MRTPRIPPGPWADLFALLAATVVILLPAIHNGYPLVYADTGTYLRSAFEGFVPVDRPYWYGVFIRITSLGGHSLWGVVIAQALLCAQLLLAVAKRLSPGMLQRPLWLLALGLIATCSGLGWYACQVMPDVFTPIGALALYLFLHEYGIRTKRVLLGVLVLIACWVHLSNLLILPLCGALLLVLRWQEAQRPGQVFALAVITALGWSGLAIANRAVDGRFYISRGSHVFMMGRLLETGVLKQWLADHCATEHPRICAYPDSLPANAEKFMWDGRSPLQWQGGWDSTREEYSAIVRSALADPRYWGAHIGGSLRSTADQLTRWKLGESISGKYFRDPTSPPAFMIRNTLEHEYTNYLASRQNGGNGHELDIALNELFYRLLIAASLLFAFWRWRSADRAQRTMLLFALAVIVIGAWVCATFSMADSRYIARASWLLPIAVLTTVRHTRAAGGPAT